MGRPTSGYYLEPEHERVPGVTTVIGRFKDAGGLIHWAWQQGMEGVNYRETRDVAASVGHLAHDALEAKIRQQDMAAFWNDARQRYDEGQVTLARESFTTACEELSQYEGSFRYTEHPLVSRKWRVGGTPDAVGQDRRKRWIMFDWKTGRGLYADAVIQVVQYCRMWEERYPDVRIHRLKIFRFDKETGDMQQWSFLRDRLGEAEELFDLYRRAYELDKKLQRRVK